jgi:tetratricopeptide (TPR) repeat protein
MSIPPEHEATSDPTTTRSTTTATAKAAVAAELDALLRSGRLDELVRALAGDELKIEPLDRHRLRGELARRRRGPVTDLVLAARAHRAAGTPHAAGLCASAAQALSRLGGDALAQHMLGEVPAAPDEPPEPTADERAATLSDAASRARGRGDLVEAAEHSAGAAAASADSDRAASLRFGAALDAWASGQSGALVALRTVRDDDGAPAAVRRQAREALDEIESEPGRAPSWQFARELPEVRAGSPLALIGRAMGTSIAERAVPTASHLRAALADAGVETLRVVLDVDLLLRLLAEPGVLVLLEEEQSRHAAFLLVRGVERTAGLILVIDPAVGGASLRPLPEQWRRSELGGRGALVATGVGTAGAARRGALEAAGIVDDPRLALIDRCHFDPQDPDVPFAHVAQLAGKAIAAAPEIGMAHKRLGEALLGLLRLDNLEAEECRMERWVGETRERFPDAEWPHQIYAQALECWGRWAEALVSWCDAGQIDPDDDRNLMGQVRTARQTGGLSGGRGQLRRALAANPTDARAWTWLAEEELAADRQDAEREGREEDGVGHLADAEIAADLAAALEPDAVPVVLLQTTVAERRGALEEATALLERVADADEAGQGIRLWRRYLCAGRWDDLRGHSQRMLRSFPGSSGAWSVYMDALVALGDGESAIDAIFGSIQRVPGGFVENFSEVLLTFPPPGALPDLLARLEEALGGAPDAVTRTARAIGFGGRAAEGMAVLERLARRHPDDANTHYALGQLRMLSGDRDGARAAFARAIEIHDQFPWVRYLYAWLLLDDDPQAAIDVAAPAVRSAPALFWDVIARALERSGRAGDAAELRGRLPDVAGEVVEHADFLRDKGLGEPLRELLELAATRDRTVAVRYHLGLAHGALDRHQAAVDEILSAYREAPGPNVGAALLRQAALAGRGDLVIELGAEVARSCRADSSRYADPWIPEAIAAAAADAAGDPAPREQFLAAAGRHAHALRALVRAGRALGAARAADDLARLAAIAPGSASTIDQPEP